jgi:reactive chlorine resistance protein C
MTYDFLNWGDRIRQLGGVVLRYSLVVIFVAFGLLKFTPQEAADIQPLGVHSPVLFWLYAITDPRRASDVIGVVELILAALIACRRFNPRLSAIGSLGTCFALITTLSFLITTPKLSPDFQGFILKDLTLLGAALWSAGEALGAARTKLALSRAQPLAT